MACKIPPPLDTKQLEIGFRFQPLERDNVKRKADKQPYAHQPCPVSAHPTLPSDPNPTAERAFLRTALRAFRRSPHALFPGRVPSDSKDITPTPIPSPEPTLGSTWEIYPMMNRSRRSRPPTYRDNLCCFKKSNLHQEVGARSSGFCGDVIIHQHTQKTCVYHNQAIQCVLAGEKGADTILSGKTDVYGSHNGFGLRGKLNKVVLAYSGGLDTSVIVPWLRENYGCEVVCFTADVGQFIINSLQVFISAHLSNMPVCFLKGVMEMDGLERKAKASGASQLVVKDLKEEFVRDYIFPCLRAGAVYERKYLLGTSMARPVIAKAMVDVAKEVGADAVSHGCTGKGNDQVRFELTFFALNPELKVVAPWREWEITGREDAIEYAKKHNVPVPVSRKSIYSRDRNLWHLSHEGDILEDPANEPKKDMYMMSVDPEDAPNQPE
ncbi:hypothetical protein COCNU_scaffold003417G000030 [Cocos nucifera]|nr:hypothetical protein [Cocos nucifera]